MEGATFSVAEFTSGVVGDGSLEIADIVVDDSAVQVTGTLDGPGDRKAASISLGDALAALKIALGATAYGPYQIIAADFNNDGKVALGDALSILKYALGSTQYQPNWVFLDASDAGLTSGDLVIDKSHTMSHPIDLDLAQSATVDIVGVLRGDVDGSWGAAHA